MRGDQACGIKDGATKKSTVEVGQIFFFSGGEVVKNGDRAAGGEAADEVAADKAGATGDEEFHSLMFPPRCEDAKRFFGREGGGLEPAELPLASQVAYLA